MPLYLSCHDINATDYKTKLCQNILAQLMNVTSRDDINKNQFKYTLYIHIRYYIRLGLLPLIELSSYQMRPLSCDKSQQLQVNW